jgi:hypothetical protein
MKVYCHKEVIYQCANCGFMITEIEYNSHRYNLPCVKCKDMLLGRFKKKTIYREIEPLPARILNWIKGVSKILK